VNTRDAVYVENCDLDYLKLIVATQYLHPIYVSGCYAPEGQAWLLRHGVKVRLERRRLVWLERTQCIDRQSRQANLDINIKSA
jgi:hypothetical protein